LSETFTEKTYVSPANSLWRNRIQIVFPTIEKQLGITSIVGKFI